MDFSEALVLAKSGQSIQREGWNGKGQHVYVEEMAAALPVGKGGHVAHKRDYPPVLVLFNAQKQHQIGWLPSQGDIFADDWQIAVHA